MARTPIKREAEKTATDDHEVESAPELADDGLPPEVRNDANLARAETVIPQKPPSPTPPPPVSAAPPAGAPVQRVHTAQRYQVRSSPGRIVYAGQVMQMPPGKIIDSRSVSPELLRAQGVVLVPLND